jgi:hypothetical protein
VSTLTIRFVDNEMIQGTAEALNLDSPDFKLMVEGATNNSGAWIPLTAVKKINVESGAADQHVAQADKMVAIRFQDGEVMRGYLNGGLQHHKYGMTVRLYSPDKRTMETVAIPFTSLKALFYLKSWDGRPPGYRNKKGNQEAPLVQLIADLRELTRLYQGGGIHRDEYMARRRTLLEHF